jgi:hypothetical protein
MSAVEEEGRLEYTGKTGGIVSRSNKPRQKRCERRKRRGGTGRGNGGGEGTSDGRESRRTCPGAAIDTLDPSRTRPAVRHPPFLRLSPFPQLPFSTVNVRLFLPAFPLPSFPFLTPDDGQQHLTLSSQPFSSSSLFRRGSFVDFLPFISAATLMPVNWRGGLLLKARTLFVGNFKKLYNVPA